MAKGISGEMAFPLHWPDGQPRSRHRKSAKFKVSMAEARDHLINELKLLGARYVTISSDVPLRRDGLPYANAPQPRDPGVAIYFDYDGEQMVFACDRWKKVEHNVRAVGKTIEAIRGIARWGSTDMMKRAVSSFRHALPGQPAAEDWRGVFGFRNGRRPSLDEVKAKYRELSRVHHSDLGGNEDEMKRINIAWEAAQKELS